MGTIEKVAEFQKKFATAVQDQVGSILAGCDVAKEEASGKPYPVSINANFAPLIEAILPLHLADNVLKSLLKELSDDIAELTKSKNLADFKNNLERLVKVDALQGVPDVIKSLVKMNVDLALSFAMSAQNLADVKLESYGDAILEYLFAEKGYRTVSGKSIEPPRLFGAPEWVWPEELPVDLASIEKEIKTIKGMVKDLEKQIRAARDQMTADRYIRDITRIGVEVTGDQMYGLTSRYDILKKRFPKSPGDKLVRWFDSFGDLAEASVMPAVETILTGIGNIELNPHIVVGVATFCSVTVRKATEHAYMQVLGIK